MAEPTSSVLLPAALTFSAVSFASLLPGIDGDALIGAFAGASVFALHTKDLSIFKRLFYMLVSILMGYFGTGEVTRFTDVQHTGVAAFIGSALIVTAALSSIDRIRNFDVTSIFRRR